MNRSANKLPPGWVRLVQPSGGPAWRHEATGWEVRRVGTPRSQFAYSIHPPGGGEPLPKQQCYLGDAIAVVTRSIAQASHRPTEAPK